MIKTIFDSHKSKSFLMRFRLEILTQDISILITGIRSLQDLPKILEPQPFDSSALAGDAASFGGELPPPGGSSLLIIRDSRPNKRSNSLYI